MLDHSNDAQALTEQTTSLVREWLATADTIKPSTAATLLAGVLSEEGGLDFTVGFVDGVIRPEDPQIAAENFRSLARNTPGFLPWYLRAAVKTGSAASRVAPALVVPAAQKVLREMVGHLIVDSTDAKLGPAIDKIKRTGRKLNVNLLGEAVLGPREAAKRLAGTKRLLERDDVDYVSIKVSSTVAPHSPWAYAEAVDHVIDQLLPLYQYAASHRGRKFINLDMEEYRDLDMTIEVFTRLLDRPELLGLEAGIVLQAYLPDAMRAMQHLQEWSAARRARGGAAIKVRLVKGANLPMERVEAAVHGWPLAVVGSKQEADTNYKRVLNWAMTSERMNNVHIGVAGHNLFDVAHAWLLAGERGVREIPGALEFEMLLGMAEAQAEAVSRTVGQLLLYTPVVHPDEFDVAISYLIRRLEEGASQDNFMSAVFELSKNEPLFAREKARFEASLAQVDDSVPLANRRQDRTTDVPALQSEFANTPDTDPALPGNRGWGREILTAIPGSTLGDDFVASHTITDPAALERALTTAVDAAPEWAALGGAGRAHVLRAMATALEKNRARLMEVSASECGKTLDQSDPEISEAIDFANYYAQLAEQLDTVDGARAVPVKLTVVTPPWNFPVAIPAGSTLAALAAGSSVVIKPATQAQRSGSVMVDALWAGLDACGISRDILQLVHVSEGDLGRQLVSDPRVDRLILTGGFDTAQLFQTFRPDLQLLAETSGKNSIIVTPHADLDLAVKDVVNSAFGHAGQKCSAASLVILVGSVGRSQRFRNQLLDAVSGLRVAFPEDPTAQVGPVIEAPSGKLERALTTLAPGESWAIAPELLSEDGRLWSPGVKTGVVPGSEYHLTEYFGPILGIMTVDTLEEAIAAQNATDFGLTAGLHSLEPAEIEQWTGSVNAGNLYVNRGITGAIVRRQPFGGWKRSAVGAGTKAGGPNYLVGLSDWERAEAAASSETATIIDDVARLMSIIRSSASELGLGPADLEFLSRSVACDAAAWESEFGVMRDASGLVVERNEFRYVPTLTPVHVFVGEDSSVADVLRVVLAGLASRGIFEVVLEAPHAGLQEVLALAGMSANVSVQELSEWAQELSDGRVRAVGAPRAVLAGAIGAKPDVAIYAQPVTEAGRIEMLPFLVEQAISITAHRFGTVQPHVALGARD
ncbi:bifunctional proline dehydrogenase/L-glutamate gamma-semialdehyde dehydrogenase [Timonella senegalensis]|uniref:bifunctional proline dehydrogenase/L-glutamate gamma-semialdehyde dehydrogenase n=2 Tax=Timonella senegalensis TaxID=1465825 RepID=UPI002FDCF4B7